MVLHEVCFSTSRRYSYIIQVCKAALCLRRQVREAASGDGASERTMTLKTTGDEEQSDLVN